MQKYSLTNLVSILMQTATVLVCMACSLVASATPTCRVVRYDENNGLSHWRVTQMLQDKEGVIWFATWNGLNRFDGYDFKCFKVSNERNCLKTDDRIRDIWLSEDGDIYCKSDEGYYGFDPEDCTFYDIEGIDNDTLYNKQLTKSKGTWLNKLTDKDLKHTDANGYQWTLTHEGKLYCLNSETKQQEEYPLDRQLKELRFAYSDKQGNLWIIFTGGVYKMLFTDNSITHLPQELTTHVRCTFTDSYQRYWVAGRDDNSLRLFSADNQLIGYLGADGQIHRQYTPFAASIYCIMQSNSGIIWMGSKPDGLFRLQENDGHFSIVNYKHSPEDPYSLSHNDVYDIKEDKQGRMWIATLGGGINCLTNPTEKHAQFIHKGNKLKGYPMEMCKKVRFLYLTDKDIMLATTTEGLLVTQLPSDNHSYDSMTFRCHVKSPSNSASLSCSATMDIVQDEHNHLFVSTENGGLCQITTTDLLADTLHFRHFNTSNGLPSDVILSTTVHGENIWIVCSNLICVINPHNGVVNSFDSNFFQRYYRFSEAHPTQLPDGRWLFGLHDGAFTVDAQKLCKSNYIPPLMLTGIVKQGEPIDIGVAHHDTLTLYPHERNLTVHFAAIDYTNAELINYAFRLIRNEEGDWSQLGKSRSTTFLDMPPGEHALEISSTNADGVWVDNTLVTSIIVVPTFWETGWAVLLYVLISILVSGTILYTYMYIHRIKRQQRETLESYLTLLNNAHEEASTAVVKKEPAAPKMSEEDDLFMRRIMNFIEEHMADPDINVGDMAEALAISRSGLNRKLKSSLGVTPLDLLREARIKRACQLLDNRELNISEVAYQCGFSDPKYFSRCFRQAIGVSPTEYKGYR